jgi:hypothetical protein
MLGLSNECSSRFGADNIPERFEMATRKLRVMNVWPALIAALSVLWTAVSYRVGWLLPWADGERAVRSLRPRLRPGFSQFPYWSAIQVASDRPRWQTAWSRCPVRLARKLRFQRDPNCRPDTNSLLGVDLRSESSILTMRCHPRLRTPGMLS